MARAKKKETSLTIEEKLAKALVPKEEQPYPVPENWCWVRLTEGFAECKDSYRKPINATNRMNRIGNIPYYGATGQVGWIDSYLTDEELVLLGEDGAPFLDLNKDKAYLISGKAWVNNHAHILKSFFCHTGNVYMLHYLNAFNFEEYVNGTTRLKLTQSSMNKIPIPLPPLPEQQRIVTLIESLFANLDAAKEKLQAVMDGFAKRRAALLHQAFTGELTREWREEHGVGLESWENVCIGDIADVKGGKRVPKGMSLVSENTGHPYIKAGNLKNGTVVPDNVMYVPADVLQHIKQYTVNSGDVYITNVGACIGDCGIIPPEFNGANLTENAVKLTGLRCDSLFLARYLSSKPIQIDIKNRIASATLGKLSIANIKKIPVNLPPLPEQKKIVRILDDIFAKESQSKATVESALAKIDTMKKAILATAFRGGFETNDRSDGSAEELLRRVL